MTSTALERGRGAGIVLRPGGDKGTPAPGAGTFGMALFLVSLSVLFVASLVGFLAVRLSAAYWPPLGAPPLPRSLWLGTALLLGCSVAVQLALRAIRAGSQRGLVRRLLLATVLALAFLAIQGWSWQSFFHNATFSRHLYGFTFYMLTGLHAAHAVGGVVALVVVTVRAWLGAYSWAHYPGVRNAAIYWHFLDAVWLVLFGTLLAAS